MKFRFIVCGLLLMFIHGSVRCQELNTFPFTYGSLNGVTVGENLVSNYGLIGYFERKLYQVYGNDKRKISVLIRAGRLYFFYGSLSTIAYLFQHEYGGHYLRASEWGTQLSWNMSSKYLYLPFTPKSGITYWTRKVSSEQNTLVTLSGMIATNSLSQQVKLNMIKKNKINYWNSALFIISKLDLINYTLLYYQNSSSNDVYSYDLTMKYRFDITDDSFLQAIRHGAFYSAIDPIFIYILYNITNYILTGEESVGLPSFSFFKNYQVTPNVNYLHSPFGPEYHFGIFHRYKNNLVNTTFRLTTSSFFRNIGVDIEAYSMVKEHKKLPAVDLSLSLWQQKKIDEDPTHYQISQYAEGLINGFQVGCSLSKSIISINENQKLGLIIKGCYKTEGFNSAFPIGEGFLWQAGINYEVK